jgi:hypothetical protein
MAKKAQPTTPEEPITRADLERSFRTIQDGVKKQVEDRKSTLLTVAGGVGLLLTVIVFLLGRRSGKKKTTYVEIRRV